jgi:hypothetical protein
MVEKLAIAAVLLCLAGIGVSVFIAEVLRNRDAREAEQRLAVQRQAERRRQKTSHVTRPAELSPAAAAELALHASLARSTRRLN